MSARAPSSASLAARPGLLDPETLASIGNMTLRARLVVEGALTGLHKSPHMGSSVEFVEHKEYSPGDELKHIDWKVLGRSDKLYVKQFEDETNLRAYLAIDASASMGYASGRVTKLQYASYAAAALAYLMLRQTDAVGLALLADGLRSYTPPEARSSHLPVLMDALERARPGGRADLPRALDELAERIKRRGLVLVFSDLLDEPEPIIRALKLLRRRRREIILFHVLDPWEIEFPFDRTTVFASMEDERRVLVNPRRIRSHYRRELRRLTETYRSACLANHMDYWLFDTSEPLHRVLARYLATREQVTCSAYRLPTPSSSR